MTTTTVAPATGFSNDPSYAAGRADAYDDQAHTPLHVLRDRISLLVDLHPDLAYVLGYSARLIEAEREEAAVATTQTATAYTDRKRT